MRVTNHIGIKIIIPAVVLLCITACSSAPKRPKEVFAERNYAALQLDLASHNASRGLFEDALLIVEDVLRRAISVDDYPLLTKSYVSRGNILFSLGREDEAFADWEIARREADSSRNRELIAQVGIYSSRGLLMQLAGSGSTSRVEQIRSQVNGYISSIKSDRPVLAAGYIVLAMAEKELRHYDEAEKAARSALAIHDKDLYLEEAAYDWFFIASVFSVSGRYDDALSALQSAISYDRRAENGYGLASSWQAMGEVYLKKDIASDRASAVDAFRRAADIYRSIGLYESGDRADAKADAVT